MKDHSSLSVTKCYVSKTGVNAALTILRKEWIMTRIAAIVVSFIFLMGLLTGCKGSNNPAQSDDSAIGSKNYTVNVEAPQGWEATEGTGVLLRYRKGSGDFWVKKGVSFGTADKDVEYYRERENSSGYDITWEDVKDKNINGMDAKYLKYTLDTGSMKMRYDVYFIKMDTEIFTIICMTNPDSDYISLEADYKALLASLKITGN